MSLKETYKTDAMIRDRRYDMMDLTSRLESLLDRPDIDQMNADFETRQSKWLLDMAVS